MEVIINGVVYVPKEKYITIAKAINPPHKWFIINDEIDEKDCPFQTKKINIKHKEILDAYLEDNNVKIESTYNIAKEYGFIESYNEDYDYRLKPKEEYPIFKVDSEGVIIKLTSDKYEIMLDYASGNIGNCFNITNQIKEYKPIPYNKEKGLYYKQPVWCHFYVGLTICFFDAINCKVYTINNESVSIDGCHSIKPITPEQLKVMPFIWEMYKQLED